MEYHIEYMRQAVEDSKKLKANEPKAFKKLEKLVAELREHPKTGTGHPEQLKGEPHGRWSRRITQTPPDLRNPRHGSHCHRSGGIWPLRRQVMTLANNRAAHFVIEIHKMSRCCN